MPSYAVIGNWLFLVGSLLLTETRTAMTADNNQVSFPILSNVTDSSTGVPIQLFEFSINTCYLSFLCELL